MSMHAHKKETHTRIATTRHSKKKKRLQSSWVRFASGLLDISHSPPPLSVDDSKQPDDCVPANGAAPVDEYGSPAARHAHATVPAGGEGTSPR